MEVNGCKSVLNSTQKTHLDWDTENERLQKHFILNQIEDDQNPEIESRIKERRIQTLKVWRKIKLVRNQIKDLRIFEAKERANRELLKEYRERLKA